MARHYLLKPTRSLNLSWEDCQNSNFGKLVKYWVTVSQILGNSWSNTGLHFWKNKLNPSILAGYLLHLHVNKSMERTPWETPLYIGKSGVKRGKHYFSYFASKLRLWVLVRMTSFLAVLTRTTISVLSKNKESMTIFIRKMPFLDPLKKAVF